MIRRTIEIGDHVRSDDGRSGVVIAISKTKADHMAAIRPPAELAQPDFEHPVDGLARVHPPHSLDWTDDELADLWLTTPAKRNAIKAVTFARRVLQGKPT